MERLAHLPMAFAERFPALPPYACWWLFFTSSSSTSAFWGLIPPMWDSAEENSEAFSLPFEAWALAAEMAADWSTEASGAKRAKRATRVSGRERVSGGARGHEGARDWESGKIYKSDEEEREGKQASVSIGEDEG
jgi:hypothetical protein